MYQQKPQWTVYVKYRNMAVVIVKDRGFDRSNVPQMLSNALPENCFIWHFDTTKIETR